MAFQREIFSHSGPSYLTAVDWNNSHHRRCIAASLVRGVSIQELDRQQKRLGPYALAPPWWKFFHFQLIHVLVDDADCSIFGAIYEFKFPPSYCNYLVQNPPRYVVAFRGTIIKRNTFSQDLKLDIQCILNSLQRSTRVQRAMQAVEDMVARAGAANIWLAGHSLGSAVALLAGKHMGKKGCFVETYLFNPPFPSPPIEKIKNQELKNGIRIARSIITAGIAVAVSDRHQSPQNADSFAVLSGWIPYLFVNPSDYICSEYIGFFEHKLKMMESGAEAIGRLATQNSVRSLLSGALGGDLEPSHLLPSAYLTINMNPSVGFKEPHELQQWWKPNIQFESKLHQFRC